MADQHPVPREYGTSSTIHALRRVPLAAPGSSVYDPAFDVIPPNC